MFFTNLSYLRSLFHPKQLCNDKKKKWKQLWTAPVTSVSQREEWKMLQHDAWLGNSD